MVVQAGAGQRVAAADPELTGEAFAGDRRRRAPGRGRHGAPRGPALRRRRGRDGVDTADADLALVEDLVAHAAAQRPRRGAPRSRADATACRARSRTPPHRVVQESLTNALRYAAGAAVRVRVRGDAETLELEVVNGPAPRAAALAGMGTGNGLRGLRERVQACGGRLDAGPLPRGRVARRRAAAPARPPPRSPPRPPPAARRRGAGPRVVPPPPARRLGPSLTRGGGRRRAPRRPGSGRPRRGPCRPGVAYSPPRATLTSACRSAARGPGGPWAGRGG